MKYRVLRKRISELAKSKGLLVVWEEGSSHTKVCVGSKQTTIPVMLR